MTPEQIATVLEMLPNARSLREIARALNVEHGAVRAVANPIITLLRMNDELTPCPCGKPRFHPYGCRGKYSNFVSVRTPEPIDQQIRRQIIVAMLVAGERYYRIEKELALKRSSAKLYMRFLTDEQCAARAAAMPGWRHLSPTQGRDAAIARVKAKERNRPSRRGRITHSTKKSNERRHAA